MNKNILPPLLTILVFIGALLLFQNKKHKYQIVKSIHSDSIYIDSLDKFIIMSRYETQDSTFIDEFGKYKLKDTIVWH